MGAVVVVELDLEVSEVPLVVRFDLRNLLLRGDAVFFRLEHDGGAMGIVGAHVDALLTAQFLETDPDIGLDVFQQVAQVNGAIGVGKGTGHQDFAGRVTHGVDVVIPEKGWPMIRVRRGFFILWVNGCAASPTADTGRGPLRGILC